MSYPRQVGMVKETTHATGASISLITPYNPPPHPQRKRRKRHIERTQTNSRRAGLTCILFEIWVRIQKQLISDLNRFLQKREGA
jgi:hypothetical protein